MASHRDPLPAKEQTMFKPEQIKTDDLIRHLFDLGHYHVDQDGWRDGGPDLDDCLGEKRESLGVEKAIKSWQHWRALKEDGHFGPVSLESHLGEVRCGLPDIMERRGEQSEWPKECQRSITWSLDHGKLNFKDSRERTKDDAWTTAIEFWNSICGCQLIKRFTGGARIQATAGRMAGGALAWSFLPSNNCGETLKQEYNRSVSWRWFIFWTTLAHEAGHALGLPHAPRRSEVMFPSHDPDYNGMPGRWERSEVVKRYGPPQPKPEPPTPPTPDDSEIYGEGWITAGGKRYQTITIPKLDHTA